MNDKTIPKQIDVKQKVLPSQKENNDIEMKLATTPRLSPLRSLINAAEIARPQSEETRRICKRLSTELMTSIDTELDVIDEDSHPQHQDLKSMFDGAAAEEELTSPALTSPAGKQAYINKLSESALIEVLTIESKGVKTRTLLSTVSTIEVDKSKVLLVQPLTPPKVESQKEVEKALVGTTRPSIKLKDRVLIAIAVLILLIFYTTICALFVWLGLKTVQSVGYFVTASCRSNDALVSLLEFNHTDFPQASGVNDHESAIKVISDDDLMDVWSQVQQSNPITTEGPETDEKEGGDKLMQIITLNLRQCSASVTNDIITTIRNWPRIQTQIQSLVQLTLKQVTDYVEEGYDFI